VENLGFIIAGTVFIGIFILQWVHPAARRAMLDKEKDLTEPEPSTDHSRKIHYAQYSSDRQKAYLKQLYPRYPRSKKQIFGILAKLNENIKEEAMDFLESKSEKGDLMLWLQHYPRYQDLYVKHLLRFLRLHFPPEEQEALAPYAANPEVKEWFEEMRLPVPKTALVGSLDMEEEAESGEISLSERE
jgi:hypothetical protein